jgi:flagellar hook-length control protein FliK
MEGDKATLAFASQHAAVRDALESALPRLREMFAQNGLDIVDVNVSQENTPGRQEQQATVANNNPGDDDFLMASEQAIGPESGSVEGTGLVDYYI